MTRSHQLILYGFGEIQNCYIFIQNNALLCLGIGLELFIQILKYSLEQHNTIEYK